MDCDLINSTLIYLHIPKTGGSTFHTILRRNYPGKSTYNVFASSYDNPEVASFMALGKEQKAKIRLLKGHMPFGLHESLPNKSAYITFLRDPIERVISQYYYVKKSETHEHHREVHVGKMSISDFVECGIITGMNNGQCRFLTGAVKRRPYNDSEGLFEEAKLNIDSHFSWVGITERFDESILTLQESIGWQYLPVYIKQNVSKIRKKATQFSNQELDVIRTYNSEDIKIYEYANSMLNNNIEADCQFKDKLTKLSTYNSRLNRYFGPLPDRFQYSAIKFLSPMFKAR